MYVCVGFALFTFSYQKKRKNGFRLWIHKIQFMVKKLKPQQQQQNLLPPFFVDYRYF